jgi:hypothetical protein
MTFIVARPRRLTRTQRRALLALHAALLVGWLGASIVMLTLATFARVYQPGDPARRAYWAVHLLATVLLIPLSLSVLVVGLVVAATTPWGLLRSWWAVVKLYATIVAVGLSMATLPAMAKVAYRAATNHALAAERSAGTRLIIAGSVSVVLYLTLTTISMVKPWGRTARGERHSHSGAQPTQRGPDRSCCAASTDAARSIRQ